MRALVAAVLLVVACGPSSDGNTLPPKTMSATEHESAAMEHEREASAHDREAKARDEADPGADQRCFDEPVPSMTESGGEKIEMLRPCWTSLTSPKAREQERAKEHRERAAEHRARAKELRATETEHCAGFGEAELSRTPFANRRDVLSVKKRDDGAVIAFRKVPGLTAAWMKSSLECHYARAAVLGFPETFLSASPITLPDVTFDVADTDDAIVVTVRSKRSEIAAAVLGRAQDLLRDATP